MTNHNPPNLRNRMIIQIAGIRDLREASVLAESGAGFLGFPLRLDYHRPDLSEAEARKIIAVLPEAVTPVLITYLTKAKEVIDFCDYLGVGWVQLHGYISADELAELKEIRPGLQVIKSLIVRGGNIEGLSAEVEIYQAFADYFITDTYDEATGASGATGKTHDWEVSRRIVEISPKPVILAGGLNPENVAEAIKIVRPAGVDVHTGVEGPDGRKDGEKVRRFIGEVEKANGVIKN